MEDKPLSIESSKEEVAEYFVKNFKLPELNKEILINEDISGDVLPQLSQLTQSNFLELLSRGNNKTKVVTFLKLKTYLEKNKDNFKEKEKKEIITANSNPEEVKRFFNKCLNFQKDLNGLNGKDLLDLDEQKMKQLGLNLGQRFKLIKYINYFNTLIIDLVPKDKYEITKNSSEEEVAEFLKLKLNFSKESIESLGLDVDSFIQLKIEDIDSFNDLKEEERIKLKKFLSGEFKDGEENPESEIIITKKSNEEEVSTFLKKKLGFKREAIEELEGLDGDLLLSLTEERIEELKSLSLEEKNKIKEFIINSNYKNNIDEKVGEINEKSKEDELIKFIKNKLNLNELSMKTLIEIDIEKIPNLREKEKVILINFIKEKKKLNCINTINTNISEKLESQENLDKAGFLFEELNQIKGSSEYIDFYFVIGINQKDHQDYKICVQAQGVDKDCNELFKTPFVWNDERYYQILYNLKLKKNSKYCLIKIFSKTYNKWFKNNNQNIIFNDEDIYFVLENLTFSSFTIPKYAVFWEEIKPPKLFIQDFDLIFSTFYSYIWNLNPKNRKLISQLFFRGYAHLKDLNNKYTIAFFLQVLSLSINDNNIFHRIISLFNINCLKTRKLHKNLNLNNIRPNLELLLKIYSNKDIRNDVNIALKLDTLISFCYLILYDVKSSLKFINDSPYKNDLISNIISKIDYFETYIFNKELLNTLLLNCNKNDLDIVHIISKCLNFVDYIELIYENIDIFKNVTFKLNKTFQFEKHGKSEEMIP